MGAAMVTNPGSNPVHDVVLATILVLTVGPAARADVVPPPEKDLKCSRGQEIETRHSGTRCAFKRCQTAADCPTGMFCVARRESECDPRGAPCGTYEVRRCSEQDTPPPPPVTRPRSALVGPGPNGEKTMQPREWMKGLPEPGPGSSQADLEKYLQALQKRIAEGRTLRVHATVEHFLPIALSSHRKDPPGGIHVAGTYLRITAPEPYQGWRILVHHASPPPEPSCWRVEGCAAEFDLNERLLELQLVRRGLGSGRFLYDRDLKNLTPASPATDARPPVPDAGAKKAGPR
jgi:hypothetical protein